MASRDLRILCLGYCFPPVASPESFVSAKTMAAIPDARVDVVTSSHHMHLQPPDHSLDEYVTERFGKIFHIDDRRFRALGKVQRIPLRPDRYLLLTGRTAAVAKSMRPEDYDVLVTRSQYHSVHVAGRRLKRRYPELPWVACFSDPWSGSIFEREIPILSAWSRRLERSVLQSADALVYPTSEMRAHVAREHPDLPLDGHSHVVPHGFDPDLCVDGSEKPNATPVRLAMFGAFYGPRSPKLLVEAFEAVAAQPDVPDFVFHIYGSNSAVLLEHTSGHPDAAERIAHMGTLTHTDALKAMATYDILVMTDAPTAEPSIFLSSKVVDYLGARRPVFAITPRGATAELVQRTGGWSVGPDDPAAIANSLAAAIRAAVENVQRVPADVRDEYHIANIGRRFRQILDPLVEKAGAR